MKKPYLLLLVLTYIMFSCSHEKNSITTEKLSKIESSSESAIVSTEYGKVAGYIDNQIYTFKGIPYAKAERFMPPESPDKWEGIRSSRAYGPTCPQGKRLGWYSDDQAFAFDWDDGFTNEDCLRLNIWTPEINNKSKRPVMVWLHGGGFSAGSSQELPSYDGNQLSKTGDVIIVSLNHRLNVLGFLDLSAYGEKYAKSGNVGLLDIISALKWIQSNIESFGGDPSNITIMGQSGGGGKVCTLMACPEAKGLFQKAIVQSGSILNLMESKYSRKIGELVMQNLGLKSSQIDSLKKIPYENLLNAGNLAIQEVRQEATKDGFYSFIFGWTPTVDGYVLPYQPYELHAQELSKNIPVIVGTTQNEFTASNYIPAYRNITEEKAITELQKKYQNKTEEFVKKFKIAYPNSKPVDYFDTDFIFRPAAVKQMSIKYALKGAPVYAYMFNWESPVLDGIFRSTHCMELPFTFNNIARCRTMTGGGEEAYVLADKMSRAWTNFAKTGNPNAEGLPTWEPYTIEKGATMIFDNTCDVKYNHDKELLDIVNMFPSWSF